MKVLEKPQIIVVCKGCGSVLLVDPSDIKSSDTYYNATYVHCPMCNKFNYIVNKDGSIESNVKFKKK